MPTCVLFFVCCGLDVEQMDFPKVALEMTCDIQYQSGMFDAISDIGNVCLF